MRLNKTLRFAIAFENFSRAMGIPARDLAQMILNATASVRAYERDQNKYHEVHQHEVEMIAHTFGCEVDWPGLWPCIQKIGKTETNTRLPSPE